MQKLKKKLTRFRKKNSSFSDNLGEELDDKFSITQNDCHQTDFYPCVNCVTTKFKRLTRDLCEKSCPSIEKNILIKDKCNKWCNTGIKIAKRNMRHAEKNIGRMKQLKGNTTSATTTSNKI